MATWAIVPAAGRGTRIGSPVPKQYLTLAGRSIIEHTLGVLLAHPLIDGVMVALAPGDADWPGLTSLHGKPVKTCVGGATRAASVLHALQAVSCDAVVVHDAARPLLTAGDLTAVMDAAFVDLSRGAILASPVADTLKRADPSGSIAATVDRSSLWRALTPQVFGRDALLTALSSALAAGAEVTDEASAMEFAGVSPRLVEGRADNLKITTPADLALAEFVLRAG